MRTEPLNKIVTSHVLASKIEITDIRANGGRLIVKLKPQLSLFAAQLVRTAAQKIFIPSTKNSPFLPDALIEKALKSCPPTIASKIEIVDKDKTLCNKVKKYFNPVFWEVPEDASETREAYSYVFDFLYKLALASQFHAEADIHSLSLIESKIDKLRNDVNDDEAKARLDQLSGIYCLYQKPMRINTLMLCPTKTNSFISKRVSSLLEEAEIIELSKDRYLLGIPSKTKIAMKKIKKRVATVLENPRYSGQLNAATDLIKTVSSSSGISMTTVDVYEILKNLQISSYSPPLINLDTFRYKIMRKLNCSGFGVALGDGAVFVHYPDENVLSRQVFLQK